MRTTATRDPRTVDLGLLVVRLVFGALFAAHGGQKLFGWFRGPGLRGTGDFFESLGFHPGRRYATAAGLTELASGLLILLGFLGPVGCARSRSASSSRRTPARQSSVPSGECSPRTS